MIETTSRFSRASRAFGLPPPKAGGAKRIFYWGRSPTPLTFFEKKASKETFTKIICAINETEVILFDQTRSQTKQKKVILGDR